MTQTISTTASATTPAAPTKRRRPWRAWTLVTAAIAALVVWAISVPVLGLDLTVGAGATSQTIGPASVAVVPFVAGGAAWALLALLERLTARGRRAWKITGWAFLAVSLLGPLTMASGGVLVTLLVMHLVVGVTLILGLSAKRVV